MNAKNMEQQPDWKAIAAQLRKPQGEMAHDIALRMNESNVFINRYTLEALNLENGMDVLEIGMGNGLFVPEIFDIADVRYTGIDYSSEMVRTATENNLDLCRDGKATFLHTAIEDFPAGDFCELPERCRGVSRR